MLLIASGPLLTFRACEENNNLRPSAIQLISLRKSPVATSTTLAGRASLCLLRRARRRNQYSDLRLVICSPSLSLSVSVSLSTMSTYRIFCFYLLARRLLRKKCFYLQLRDECFRLPTLALSTFALRHQP